MISRQSLFRILQVSDQADEHQILYQVADSACPSCVDEFCERPLVKVHMLYAKERLEGPLRGFRGEEAAFEARRRLPRRRAKMSRASSCSTIRSKSSLGMSSSTGAIVEDTVFGQMEKA